MYKKLGLSAVLLASAINAQAMGVTLDLDLTNPESTEGSKWEYNQVFWGFGYWSESPYYAMEYNYVSEDLDLSAMVSGWSYDSNGVIEPEYVGNWSQETGLYADYGLGVEDAHSPDHAVDNYMNDYDMILLEFSEAVDLSGVSAGWRSNGYGGTYSNGSAANSELSLLAFGGDEVNLGGFTGKVWEDLLDEGWSSAGDYQIESLNQTEEVNTSGIVSKYWLVGAYNSALGGNGNFSEGNDFFKVTGITATVNPVPLPGSMMMFGLALLGFGAYRRRKAK